MYKVFTMKHVKQISASLLINILALGTGATYGIANVLLAALAESKSNSNNADNQTQSNAIAENGPWYFTVNSGEASWIASFSMIGQYFPIFFVGPVMGKFGKRISLMIDSVLFAIGFLLMTLAIDVRMLYAAKFFFGYAYLTSRSSIQPFIGEISDPSIRGFTSTLWSLFFISGQALSMLASGYLGWRYVSGFFGALMIACFIGILFIHETPEWLLETRKFDIAIKALEFYQTDKKLLVTNDNKRKSKIGEERSYTELVKLYRIESKKSSQRIEPKKSSQDERETKDELFLDENKPTWKKKVKDKFENVKMTAKRPEIYKPFRFLIVIFGLLELSGFAVLANYSIIMVENYGYGNKTFVTPETLMTIITLLRIPMSFMAMPLLKKFKKRPLYLSVCCFLLIIISGIIAFTHIMETGSLSQEALQNSIGLQLIPFILFILFYSGFSSGYGNVPFTLMGELFPSSVASQANTTILVLVNTIELTAVKTALLIKDGSGLQYTFVIPAIAIFCSAVYAFIFMPETHGLTLKEIGSIYAEKGQRAMHEEEKLPYFSALRGTEGNLEAMRNIQGLAYAFISSHDLRGSISAKRLGPRMQTGSFKTKANEVLQKQSVINAFTAP